MTARYLPRELGVVIRCNETIGEDRCPTTFHTANIMIRTNRAAAKRDGWIRGGGKGRRRHDYCPACAPLEVARIAEEKRVSEELKERRRAAKKARMAPPENPVHIEAM